MRLPDREADPISEYLARRTARVGDTRARRYALRVVQPSPARLAAPEPDAWLPIDLTAELRAVDFTGELELLQLEEGQLDLDRELAELESDFWRTAESEHPFLTGALPETAAPLSIFDRAPEVPVAEELPEHESTPVARVAPAVPDVETGPLEAEPEVVAEASWPVPEEYAALRPNRPAIVARRRALRLRRRLILTALVVAVTAALVVVAGQVMGGTPPRRDVTVSVDGRASTVVTREGTVADLLAAEGVALRRGDRVVPSLSTRLRQGIAVHVVHSFPVVVDVDGTVTHRRTTQHSVADLRHELHVPRAMVRVGGGATLARGEHVVLRTPHDVVVTVDGTQTPVPHSTALTVGELLGAWKVTVGPRDEVLPAADARLASGMAIQVVRVADDQVVEDQVIPFQLQYRDDASLAAGHTRTIQEGRNGLAHVISNVVRQDGVIKEWHEASRVVVQEPVTRILARGTKRSGSQVPPAPPATGAGGAYIQSGTATWYQSHAGPGSCAHLTLPFGTVLKLVASNGRTAQCRVGDRGPEAWTGNIIDLNPDVFQQLAPLGTGKIFVKVYRAG